MLFWKKPCGGTRSFALAERRGRRGSSGKEATSAGGTMQEVFFERREAAGGGKGALPLFEGVSAAV